MGEELNVSGVAAESQDAPGSNGGEAEFIRASDAQRMIEEAVEKALRLSQSHTDKTSFKLTQQLGELKGTIEQLKASGSPVPEDTLAAMRELSSSLNTPVDDREAGEEQEVDVNKLAAKIFHDAGVIVYNNDAEARMIDHSTPERFLETLEQAAKAKASREQGGDNNNGDREHIPMIGKAGVTNHISHLREPKDLYAIALGERRR